MKEMANVFGTSGNDFIHELGDNRTPPANYNEITGVTDGADNIDGKEGDDIIFGDGTAGGGGDDTIFGGSGNDILVSVGGADRLDGGNGTDIAFYGGAPAAINVNLASNIGIGSYAEGDTYTSIENLGGTRFSDVLIGDSSANNLQGLGGDDFLSGGGGPDVLLGGDGNDFILDDTGASSEMNGEAGNDTIYGGPGNDYITGSDGDDIIVGGTDGQDSLFGGAGNDYIVAADADNNGVGSALDGGAGANQLYALVGSGNDYAVGGEGADIIATGAGSDFIFGTGGNDTIVAGTGTDYIYGNVDNDFIYTDDLVTPSQDFVYVSGLSIFATGIDTMADFTPGFGGDVAVIVGTPGLTSFAQVQAAMTDIGVYTVIDLSGGNQCQSCEQYRNRQLC